MLVPSQHPGGWKSSALVKDRKAQQREIRDSPQQQEIRDFTATTDPGGQQRTTPFHPAPRATFLLVPTPQTAKPGMLRQGRAELLCQHDLAKVQIAKKKKKYGNKASASHFSLAFCRNLQAVVPRLSHLQALPPICKANLFSSFAPPWERGSLVTED